MIRAEIPQEDMYRWEDQAAQYPLRGGPGVVYAPMTNVHVQQRYPGSAPIDCLLYYAPASRGPGYLVAILNHYPEDLPPFEKAGAVNVWVKPNQQGKGYAGLLWDEAVRRWDIDWRDSRYTPEGAARVAHRYGLEVEQ